MTYRLSRFKVVDKYIWFWGVNDIVQFVLLRKEFMLGFEHNAYKSHK